MRILNIGSLNLDYVYSVDHIILPGETEAQKEDSFFVLYNLATVANFLFSKFIKESIKQNIHCSV